MTDLLPLAQASVLSCTTCWLHEHASSPTPYRGPSPAKIVVVGGSPSKPDDTSRSPFSDGAGNKISRALAGTRVKRSEVGWCHAVSCWAGEHKGRRRQPAIEELAACHGNLMVQLMAARPTVLLLAGKVALDAFRPDLSVTKDRGRALYLMLGDRPVTAIPTFHPDGAKTKELRDLMERDVKQAAWRASRGKEGRLSRWPEDCRACAAPVTHYDEQGVAWCDTHRPSETIEDLSAVPMTLGV